MRAPPAATAAKLFVRVTVSEDRIEAVTVTQHKEYRGIAWGLNTTPIERYPELIVEYQSLNIPVVDGADLTCAAILDATAAALKAAGASKEDIAALRAAPAPKAPEYPDEVRTVDVVVCGAGAGGLAAAIEAKLAGADVVIVEKQGITGGATARSGGKPSAPERGGRKSRACTTRRTWSMTTSWTSATATASSWTHRKTAIWSITSTRRSTGSPPSRRP